MAENIQDKPVFTPFRFGRINPGLMRGAYPTLQNFPFLARLNLKTIVSLTPEPPTADLIEFARAYSIQLIHISIIRTAPLTGSLLNSLANAVRICIDNSNLPAYVHCLDGRRITGLFVLFLRKLQGWSSLYSISEYWRYFLYTKGPGTTLSPLEVEKNTREIEKFFSPFSIASSTSASSSSSSSVTTSSSSTNPFSSSSSSTSSLSSSSISPSSTSSSSPNTLSTSSLSLPSNPSSSSSSTSSSVTSSSSSYDSIEFLLPSELPSWLWEGEWNGFAPPGIRIRAAEPSLPPPPVPPLQSPSIDSLSSSLATAFVIESPENVPFEEEGDVTVIKV